MRRVLAGLLLLGVLVVVPVAPAVAQAPGCDVRSAELTWGFKESFRAYIDGSIANGEWTVADGAGYETPSFGFPATAGRVDPRDPNGSIEFAGSVRFTGHGGILDTTIANPVLVLRGDGTGLLLLDVSGPTMDGAPVSVAATPFVTVDLAGQQLAPVDGVVTIGSAATALTADGEAAFPNYPAGEAFDPVSATIDLGDCDLGGQPVGTDTTDLEPGMIGDATPFVVIVAALVGLLLVCLVVLLVLRLRR